MQHPFVLGRETHGGFITASPSFSLEIHDNPSHRKLVRINHMTLPKSERIELFLPSLWLKKKKKSRRSYNRLHYTKFRCWLNVGKSGLSYFLWWASVGRLTFCFFNCGLAIICYCVVSLLVPLMKLKDSYTMYILYTYTILSDDFLKIVSITSKNQHSPQS